MHIERPAGAGEAERSVSYRPARRSRVQPETAHRGAVASALEWTAREVAVVRRKHKGIVRFETPAGLLAAEAVQRPAGSAATGRRRGSPTRNCTATSR